jgi:hypothetical protein
VRSVLAIAALARVAAAEPPAVATPTPPDPPAGEPSYRFQTATVDAIAIGLTTLAFSAKSDGSGYLGIGTYLLGAPIVHIVHDHPGRAAGSFGLRVLLPFIGGVIGDKQGGCHGDACDSGNAGLGLFSGMVAATVLDTLWLAEGDEAPPRASWSPTVSAGHAGVSLGVTGSF